MVAGSAIDAVVCDFGGVLTSPLAHSFRDVCERSGIPLEALGAALAAIGQRDGVQLLHELECGRVCEADFFTAVADELAVALDRDVVMHDFPARYFASLTPNEPMIELIAELRGAGYRTACLTNNVREWQPLWQAMAPIDELFELVVDSAFVGMRKPDREIYELTVQRLDVPAERCLFIDDIAVNCAAAREIGMQAVLYREHDQAIAEIRAALGQLSEPSRSQR
ncbi:MAG: HAD family phosphatase [Solirubrobacterales bacterium]|nr:HAD family phosphatase [Solirubrobacterales bacterium]